MVEKVIDDQENTQLTKDMTLDELSDCIKSLDHKKSPGIDGIQAEFYQLYWDIIKEEFYEMVLYSLNNLTLSESQYKALIILIEKGEDPSLLSSWRPISLLCVDMKIITKTISLRLKTVIEKYVSENQFCTPY